MMKDKVTVLTDKIEDLRRQVEEAEDTREQAICAVNQLETMMASIANQWGLGEPTSTVPKNTRTKKSGKTKAETKVETKAEPNVETNVETKAETKAEPKAETKVETKAEPKAETKVETKAEPKAETKAEPKAEPKVETKAEAEDEDAIEVEQDGVRYVVFLDTNEVSEADDAEETIVGTWDSKAKKIVLGA